MSTTSLTGKKKHPEMSGVGEGGSEDTIHATLKCRERRRKERPEAGTDSNTKKPQC